MRQHEPLVYHCSRYPSEIGMFDAERLRWLTDNFHSFDDVQAWRDAVQEQVIDTIHSDYKLPSLDMIRSNELERRPNTHVDANYKTILGYSSYPTLWYGGVLKIAGYRAAEYLAPGSFDGALVSNRGYNFFVSKLGQAYMQKSGIQPRTYPPGTLLLAHEDSVHSEPFSQATPQTRQTQSPRSASPDPIRTILRRFNVQADERTKQIYAVSKTNALAA